MTRATPKPAEPRRSRHPAHRSDHGATRQVHDLRGMGVHARGRGFPLDADTVLRLQRTAGNAATASLLAGPAAVAVQKSGCGGDCTCAGCEEPVIVARSPLDWALDQARGVLRNLRGDSRARAGELTGSAASTGGNITAEGSAKGAAFTSDAGRSRAALGTEATTGRARLQDRDTATRRQLGTAATSGRARLNVAAAGRRRQLQGQAATAKARLRASFSAVRDRARTGLGAAHGKVGADTTELRASAAAVTGRLRGAWPSFAGGLRASITGLMARTNVLKAEKNALIAEAGAPGGDVDGWAGRWQALQQNVGALEASPAPRTRLARFAGGLRLRAGAVFGRFTGRAQGLVSRVASAASRGWRGLQSSWGLLKGAAAQKLGALRAVAGTAWNSLRHLTTHALSGLKTVVTRAWHGFRGHASRAWGSLKSKAGQAWRSLTRTVSAGWSGLRTRAESLVGSLRSRATGAVSSIRSAGGSIRRFFGSLVDRPVSFLRDAGSSVVSGLRGLGSRAWGGLRDLGNRVTTGLRDLGSWAWSGLRDFGTRALSGLRNLGSRALDGLRSVGKWACDGLKSLGGLIVRGVQAAWAGITAVANALLRIIQRGWQLLKDGVQALWRRIQAAARRFLAWLKGVWDASKRWVIAAWATLMAAWAWLKNLPRQICYRIFKSCYSHYLPREFLDRYHSGTGGTRTLNPQEMIDCNPEIDLEDSTDFRRERDELQSTGGGSKHITGRSLSVAQTNGTLGNFTATYDGTLNVRRDGSWSFEGLVDFYDYWDFDPQAWGERSKYAEVLTRIAALCLSGEGFHITSARARIIQNDADAWARFPAFAGFALG